MYLIKERKKHANQDKTPLPKLYRYKPNTTWNKSYPPENNPLQNQENKLDYSPQKMKMKVMFRQELTFPITDISIFPSGNQRAKDDRSHCNAKLPTQALLNWIRTYSMRETIQATARPRSVERSETNACWLPDKCYRCCSTWINVQ